MKKLFKLLFVIFLGLFTIESYAEMPGDRPGREKRSVYRPGGRTYQPTPFYSLKRTPTKKNHKNMPSLKKR